MNPGGNESTRSIDYEYFSFFFVTSPGSSHRKFYERSTILDVDKQHRVFNDITCRLVIQLAVSFLGHHRIFHINYRKVNSSLGHKHAPT
jgi:hypothetical protein